MQVQTARPLSPPQLVTIAFKQDFQNLICKTYREHLQSKHEKENLTQRSGLGIGQHQDGEKSGVIGGQRQAARDVAPRCLHLHLRQMP